MKLIKEYTNIKEKHSSPHPINTIAPHDPEKLKNVYSIVSDMLDSTDEVAIKMLLGGFENDLDKMLDNIVKETYRLLYGFDYNKTNFIPNNGMYLKEISDAVEEQMKIYSLTYFNSTVLGMEINWHHIEWGWLIEEFTMTCILAARDHGKSYYISYGYPAWKAYGYDKRSRNVRRLNGKRGIIFSNTSSQVVDIIETLREGIEDNDELRERLYPRQKETWSKTAIKTRNGCIIRGRSMNSTTRGAHPGYIVLDDVLKDNVLYSKTQRERNKDFFNSSILPMLIPGGEMRVVGTPFHQNDLYALFREGIDFAYREYPAIDDKGNLLWASRHSLADLEMRKRIQGTTIFTREFLVKPISNFNSLFPQNILDRSKYSNISYINNIEASEIKNFIKVVTAGDFAISGNVGADFTVFVTFGIDESENMWLLNIFRKKGMTFEEQKQKLKSIWRAFKSDIVLLENNQFQEIYSQSLKAETQMPVKGYTTTIRKNDLANGVPGLALLFENGKFRFPYKTDEDKKVTNEIYEEFLNIVFTDKGVAASVGNHDDIPMAIYIAKEAVFMTVIKNNFLYDFVGDDPNDIGNLDQQYLQQSFNQYNIY